MQWLLLYRPVSAGRQSGGAATAPDSNRTSSTRHRTMRQGDRSGQVFKEAVAHSVDLSVWQTVQAFGIFSASVSPGVTKWKVWLRTRWSEIVSAIFGM